MAQSRDDGSIAPRRSLSGPILPPPPPELAEKSRRAEAERARQEQVTQERAEQAAQQRAAQEKVEQEKIEQDRATQERAAQERAARQRSEADQHASRESAQGEPAQGWAESPAESSATAKPPRKGGTTRAPAKSGPSRTRRARLRLVQVDAWSVMKTAFLLSIAIGIVLVVAVAIIWTVLGAAGVWDSINSIVQQAVGGENGKPFDIRDYAGTSRVLGLTMIVAVIDVILITAIATLGAFLYNLSAALLGGIEVTFAED